MSIENDSLEQIWSQQKTGKIDFSDVYRRFKMQRWRQRLYVGFDFLAMLPMLYAVIFLRSQFSTVSWIGLCLIGGLCVVFFVYITWLRRFALFYKADQTEHYLKLLQKQLSNNAKIAMLTKHSCWVTLLILILYYLFLFDIGEISQEKWHFLTRVLVPSLSVFLGIAGVWAHKRQLKFINDLNQLQKMYAEH